MCEGRYRMLWLVLLPIFCVRPRDIRINLSTKETINVEKKLRLLWSMGDIKGRCIIGLSELPWEEKDVMVWYNEAEDNRPRDGASECMSNWVMSLIKPVL
jgi:hypothetical protein